MTFDNFLLDTFTDHNGGAHSLPASCSIVPDNPEEAADAVVASHIGTCESYIRDVASLIYLCCNKFQTIEEQTRFSKRLEKLCFLSARDAAAPMRLSSKLSMLKKVGQYADLFCDPRVLPFLAPEHSKLYQLALLFEVLDCDAERFLVELERLGSDFTRDDVIACIGKIKAEVQRKEFSADEPVTGHSEPTPDKQPDAIPIDVIAGVVSASDVRVLRREMADPSEFDRLLPRPVLSEGAALVVLAKLSELSVVETRLTPHFGFGRTAHVFVVGNTTSIDLIDQEVLVVATRGKVDCAIPEAPIPASDNPADVALALFGNAERKFQLFDSSETRVGWETLNWSER